MIKSIKILKSYYSLAKVKFYLILLEFIFLLIPSILSVISPVLTANVISEITVYNFSKAIYNLTLNFIFILVSAVSYLCYHAVSTKVNKIIIVNFNDYVYENIKVNQNLSKVKMSVINSIFTCAEFNKNFLYKLCFFVKSIVLLIIIIYYNMFIGLGIIAISFISYFLLRFTDKGIQKNDSKLSDLKLSSIELLSSIRKGVQVENNFNIDSTLKDKYFGYVDSSVKTNNKIALYYNLNNNFISLILKTAVYISTIYLILQVKATMLTLSLYLILTPYLTNSAQNLISFFELFTEFGTIDNILSELDALKFQTEDKPQKKIELTTYNIYFHQTSLNEKNKPKINEFNLKINFGEIVNFVGEENCGKRAIFLMLKKECPTSTGSIFIDNKNISEIDIDDYKKIVVETSKQPYFYNMSIQENLSLICQNKSKITNSIKTFGLKEDIDKLKNKINTLISDEIDSKLLYFLGLLRAYLSDAKIILIYEIPDNLNILEIDKFKKILSYLKRRRTIILFTHNDDYMKQVDELYYIEKSEIKTAKNLKK